jgi:hypothetical protein
MNIEIQLNKIKKAISIIESSDSFYENDLNDLYEKTRFPLLSIDGINSLTIEEDLSVALVSCKEAISLFLSGDKSAITSSVKHYKNDVCGNDHFLHKLKFTGNGSSVLFRGYILEARGFDGWTYEKSQLQDLVVVINGETQIIGDNSELHDYLIEFFEDTTVDHPWGVLAEAGDLMLAKQIISCVTPTFNEVSNLVEKSDFIYA